MITRAPSVDWPAALRRVDLPEVPGTLCLSAMPGRTDTWPAFVADAARARLSLVLCLTPRHEVAGLSPDYHAAIEAGTLPFEWLGVPMRDFGLFADLGPYAGAVRQVATHLRGGGVALLHCAAGIGRTGTTAACVLKTLGLTTQDARRRVQAAGSNPESALQSGLIDRFGAEPA